MRDVHSSKKLASFFFAGSWSNRGNMSFLPLKGGKRKIELVAIPGAVCIWCQALRPSQGGCQGRRTWHRCDLGNAGSQQTPGWSRSLQTPGIRTGLAKLKSKNYYVSKLFHSNRTDFSKHIVFSPKIVIWTLYLSYCRNFNLYYNSKVRYARSFWDRKSMKFW